MQHAGAHTLSNQTAPAVFLEAHDGEAHHLGAAAGNRCAAGKTRQAQGRADGGGGDGQGQGNADDHGYQNAHPEGLQDGGPADKGAHRRCRRADGGGYQIGNQNARQHRDDGCHQNVDFRLLGYQLAALGSHDSHKVHGQRAAGAAHGVGGKAHGNQGEQHQRRAVQGEADGDSNAGADHGGAQAADGILHRALTGADGDDGILQKGNAELLTDGVKDGAHQQRAEQTLGHGAEGVNAIALESEDHILAGKKFFPLVHK